MNVLALKIILMILMGVITLICGLLPIKVLKILRKRAARHLPPDSELSASHDHLHASKWPSLILCLLTCFSGGIFLATCFLDLLPEVNRHFSDINNAFHLDMDYPIPELISCFGFFLVFFVEEVVVAFLHGGHGHSHAPQFSEPAPGGVVHIHDHKPGAEKHSKHPNGPQREKSTYPLLDGEEEQSKETNFMTNGDFTGTNIPEIKFTTDGFDKESLGAVPGCTEDTDDETLKDELDISNSRDNHHSKKVVPTKENWSNGGVTSSHGHRGHHGHHHGHDHEHHRSKDLKKGENGTHSGTQTPEHHLRHLHHRLHPKNGGSHGTRTPSPYSDDDHEVSDSEDCNHGNSFHMKVLDRDANDDGDDESRKAPEQDAKDFAHTKSDEHERDTSNREHERDTRNRDQERETSNHRRGEHHSRKDNSDGNHQKTDNNQEDGKQKANSRRDRSETVPKGSPERKRNARKLRSHTVAAGESLHICDDRACLTTGRRNYGSCSHIPCTSRADDGLCDLNDDLRCSVFTQVELAEPERCEGPFEGDEDPPILMTSRPHPHSHGVRSITLLLALSFHSVIEGLAFGVQGDRDGILLLFLSLIIHKCIVAFAMGLQLARTHANQINLVFISIIILAVMSPLGGAIGITVAESTQNAQSKDIVLLVFEGLAVGTFLYVTFFEILIHERDNEHPNLLKLLFLVIGFALIAGTRFFISFFRPSNSYLN